jgi:hypothetical protein
LDRENEMFQGQQDRAIHTKMFQELSSPWIEQFITRFSRDRPLLGKRKSYQDVPGTALLLDRGNHTEMFQGHQDRAIHTKVFQERPGPLLR